MNIIPGVVNLLHVGSKGYYLNFNRSGPFHTQINSFGASCIIIIIITIATYSNCSRTMTNRTVIIWICQLLTGS